MGFQFTIRDLLLVTVIAAVAAGWWIDHRHWQWVRDHLKSIETESAAKVQELTEQMAVIQLKSTSLIKSKEMEIEAKERDLAEQMNNLRLMNITLTKENDNLRTRLSTAIKTK